jgi:hypothetical protein
MIAGRQVVVADADASTLDSPCYGRFATGLRPATDIGDSADLATGGRQRARCAHETDAHECQRRRNPVFTRCRVGPAVNGQPQNPPISRWQSPMPASVRALARVPAPTSVPHRWSTSPFPESAARPSPLRRSRPVRGVRRGLLTVCVSDSETAFGSGRTAHLTSWQSFPAGVVQPTVS